MGSSRSRKKKKKKEERRRRKKKKEEREKVVFGYVERGNLEKDRETEKNTGF